MSKQHQFIIRSAKLLFASDVYAPTGFARFDFMFIWMECSTAQVLMATHVGREWRFDF